jgi:hypothetical protein
MALRGHWKGSSANIVFGSLRAPGVHAPSGAIEWPHHLFAHVRGFRVVQHKRTAIPFIIAVVMLFGAGRSRNI